MYLTNLIPHHYSYIYFLNTLKIQLFSPVLPARWCIKQEKLENIGQWKCCKLGDAQWNKKALSWPVDAEGNINLVRKHAREVRH